MARNPDATVRVINSTDERIPVDLGAGSVTITGPVTVPVEVGLNAATLAALETINALIGNWPADYPDAAVLAKLEQIRALLDATLTVDGTVALDAATLAALEATTATVGNFPADYPDAASLAKLEAIRLILAGTLTVDVTDSVFGADLRVAGGPVTGVNPVPVDIGASVVTIAEPVSVDDNGGSLTVDGPVTNAELRATPVPVSGTVSVAEPVTVDGTVALDAGTLAALEAISATIANFPADYPDAAVLAKVEAVRALLAATLTVAGTVALDGPSLAALETINAFVSGTVAVTNFPATQPVTGPLTDGELRATPVPVSGTVSVAEPVTVDGEVSLAAATLAALETIQVGNLPASQPVTGPLTDAELRATAVPVSGTVSVAEPVTVDGTVDLSGASLAALETINAVQSGTWLARVTDGVDTAEVNARTDGIVALEVADDFTSFQADHRTLVASTDTTVTFAQPVRMVVIHNWDIANRVLVKDGAIATDADAASARVGFAPAASVPGKLTLPFKTTTVHVRSAAASEVSIIGFF